MEHTASGPNSGPTVGPLKGVRILDLTTVVMGPLATRAMGDMGADVIRIEPPEGDFMRDFDPKRSDHMSAFSMNVNRNKRSVVLDLKSEAGRQALLDLAESADAFVTNLRPRALASLRITDADLRARRPDLVYCSATGFGSDGPYADKAAYDDVIQAASGLASMFAWMGDEPAYIPSIVADKVASLHITYAVVAALYQRAMTGEGEFIEVPMAESLASFNLVEHLQGHTYRPPVGEFSYQRLLTKHRKPRKSADGWVCLLPYSDQNWSDFFRLSGLDQYADDPRFATVNARIENVNALYELLEQVAITKTTAEWMELCDAHSIPAAPVAELADLGEDPHFKAVGLIEDHEHPTEGPYRVVRSPIKFRSGDPGLFQHTAGLGEHTAEVLSEIGYDQNRIDALGNRDR
jgi:crotonobetainyl-CoA:carnitine CoA-transferase CaiB-like acyl-CoA transferase